ncbi:ATP-binding protein [Robertmurraya massiliosenegalensis]|uniref:ATP-binding protein n=1 Tax=Robertmurraya TaxID=2837507 RepID=UPI0039A62809
MTVLYPITPLINNPTLIENGGHILYMFTEEDIYVGNAVQYIYEGIQKEAVIFLMETEEMMERIKRDLAKLGVSDLQLHSIIGIDSYEFYLDGPHFNHIGAGRELMALVQPYLDQGCHIRTWGQVPFPLEDPLEHLITYECSCDEFINQNRVISVCGYNGLSTPAYVQNELLKTHTHFMTDDEQYPSRSYSKKHHHSLSNAEMERIHKIEEQLKLLQSKNARLISENDSIKMKNELMQENELKLRTIINELPIPVVIRNKERILFYNEIAEDKLYIENHHFVKDTSFRSFFDEYQFKLLDHSNSKIQEHQFIHVNGKKNFYLVKSIVILFEGAPAILHTFVDITKEKENESLLIRSEKMNIAGELAASIAHELRNPLTSIKGFFHMLKNSGEEKELYYSIIEDELSRIEQISSELLSLAKPHSENRKSHNIVQIIEEVKLLLTSETNMKNIDLLLKCDNRELYICCEDTKIKQVFINLIKNAIDAMEDGGNIILQITEMKESVQIQVIDQGCGIPADLIDKIGEPFYTTKEKGTGIGLMVCYQIIEKYGGEIEMDSTEGIGTTFTITLPTAAKSLPV